MNDRTMNEELEVLIFDMGIMYRSVHESARLVCSQRGIPLREIDLSFFENESIAALYGVKPFPQCVLVRGSTVIGRTSNAIQSPKSVSDWIDKSLEEEKPNEEPGFYTYDDTPTSIYRSEDPAPYELSNGEKYTLPFNPSWVTEGPSLTRK